MSTKEILRELWTTFWEACKETPRGMAAPFVAFWNAAIHNPVLERSHQENNKHA